LEKFYNIGPKSQYH